MHSTYQYCSVFVRGSKIPPPRRPMKAPSFTNPAISSLSPLTAVGRAALDSLITEQAQVIAYIDDYKLLMIATLAVPSFAMTNGSAT
jgi:hypothetical protein